MEQGKKTGSHSLAYMIGGFAVGAACGLLLAPKKGSELVEDIGRWGRSAKKRGQELTSRAKEYIPHREKRAPAEFEI